MRLCWFKFSNLFKKNIKKAKIYSLDNLIRKGSELNERRLISNKIRNFKCNIENLICINSLPKVDLIIDCCAEPAIEESKNNPDKVFNTNLVEHLTF